MEGGMQLLCIMVQEWSVLTCAAAAVDGVKCGRERSCASSHARIYGPDD